MSLSPFILQYPTLAQLPHKALDTIDMESMMDSTEKCMFRRIKIKCKVIGRK